MLNATEIKPHTAILLFNPIATFPEGVDAARLDVIVAVSRKGVDERLEARTTIVPRREADRLFAFPLKGRVLVGTGTISRLITGAGTASIRCSRRPDTIATQRATASTSS